MITKTILDLPFLSAASPGFDPVVTDWAARVVANGGALPSTNTQKALSGFVKGCTLDGIWNKLIFVNAVAPDSLTAFNTPLLVGPTPGLWGFIGSGGTLTIDGWQQNGNGYDTGVNGTTMWSSNFDAATVFYLSRDRNGGTNPGQVFNGMMGSHGAGGILSMGVGYSSMWAFYLPWTFSILGYVCLTRTANNSEVTYMANSTNAHAAVQTDTSVRTDALPSDTIMIGQTPVGGGGTGALQGQWSFTAATKGLSSADSALLYARVQAMRVAIGGGFI